MSQPGRRTTLCRATAVAVAATLIIASCSGGSDEQVTNTEMGAPAPIESGLPDQPVPTRGGQLVYAMEAETESFCLPEAELAASGMQVLRAVYDPLVVPNGTGGYSPYLAKSVTAAPDHRTWTIILRSDIEFHDGTPLTAEVVKNNLDAYRGEYDNREPLLFLFVFDNIDRIEVTDELTLKVHTKVPWVAFDAALYNSGRIAIMSQAQLDAPKAECDKDLIGTGPFKFVDWEIGESLKVNKWEGYWQIAPDGDPYPYLNAIEFRPIPNSDMRLAALQGGDINMMHSNTASDMAVNLPRLRDDGAINLLVSDQATEVAYQMLNVSKPPFDRREARVAAAQSLDRETLNEAANFGFPSVANGPFPPGVIGHLEDPGFPSFDPEAAEAAIAKLRSEGHPTSFELLTDGDPSAVRQSVVVRDQMTAVGWDVTLEIVDQNQLIGRAIDGAFDMVVFRNHPGDDPDMNYFWWHGGTAEAPNPVNFGRFNDPVINENLEVGRRSPDEGTRREAYETINRRFASEAYSLWTTYTPWAVAEARNVHGILGPPLPDGAPATGRIATGHPMHGIWIDRS